MDNQLAEIRSMVEKKLKDAEAGLCSFNSHRDFLKEINKKLSANLDSVSNPLATEAIAAERAEVVRLSAECDQITELNHAQWLALENVRMLAGKHRKEEWAQHLLRFCNEAGNFGSPLRAALATPTQGGTQS